VFNGTRGIAQRPERGSDAALDLDDVSVGQGGRQEADHLAVLVGGLCADELQGIGVHEAVIVAEVQRVEPPAQVVDAHGPL